MSQLPDQDNQNEFDSSPNWTLKDNTQMSEVSSSAAWVNDPVPQNDGATGRAGYVSQSMSLQNTDSKLHKSIRDETHNSEEEQRASARVMT